MASGVIAWRHINYTNVTKTLKEHVDSAQKNPKSTFHQVTFFLRCIEKNGLSSVNSIGNVTDLTEEHIQLINSHNWIICSTFIKEDVVSCNTTNKAYIILGTQDLDIATMLGLEVKIAMWAELYKKVFTQPAELKGFN